ncbi:hypothetical protein MED222_06310 [Vibrio sp. MED222]|nr:hypothetical protein MED222_06310 [Vibrio sp. MED222]
MILKGSLNTPLTKPSFYLLSVR